MVYPSSIHHFLILLPLLVLIVASSSSSSSKFSTNALQFSIVASNPGGLGTNANTSPRRVYLSLKIKFEVGSTITGTPKANIWLPTSKFDAAKSKRIRTTDWSNEGSWSAANRMLSINIHSPVDHFQTTEADCFGALSELYVDVPQVHVKSKIESTSFLISFGRLNLVYHDTATVSWTTFKSNCETSAAGRFMLDFLRPYEVSAITSQLETNKDWWEGAKLVYSSGGFYCYRESLDYLSSECKDGGAYAVVKVSSGGSKTCARPSGFSCLAFSFDDSTSDSYYRLRYQTSSWDMRDTTGGNEAQACCDLQKHNEKTLVHEVFVNGTRTITISLTKSETSTTTVTSSQTVSTSTSLSLSRSESSSTSETISSSSSVSETGGTGTTSPQDTYSTSTSASRSINTESFSKNETFSRSLSYSLSKFTATHSTTKSSSLTRNTNSISKSLTETTTRTQSPVPTKTKSKSLSRSRSSSVSHATPSIDTNSFSSSFNLSLSQSQPHSSSPSQMQTVTKQPTDTRSAPLPLAKPVPALEEVQTFVLISSIAGGASVVAVARARLEAALQLSRCGSGDDLESDMDRLDNPLGIKFGTGILQSQRGAAFGNIYVVAVFGGVLTVVAVILSWYSGRSFWNAMQRVRMPGILILVLQVITPGTAQATASLWQYGPKWNDITLSIFSSVTVVFGPLILILLVTLPGFCKAVLYPLPQKKDNDGSDDDDCGKDSDESSPLDFDSGRKKKDSDLSDETNNTNTNSSLASMNNAAGGGTKKRRVKSDSSSGCLYVVWLKIAAVYSYFLVPKEDWFDQDVPPPIEARRNPSIRGDESERGFSGFTLKYGVIFEDFDRPLFAFFDLLVSTILGGTAGFAIGVLTRPTCLLLLAVATFACLAHFIYLVYRRPCLTHLMQSYMVVNSLFTLLTVVLSILVFLGQTLDFEAFTSTMLDIQTVVSLITAFLQIIALFVFFFEAYDAFKHGHDLANTYQKNTRTTATFNLEDLLLAADHHDGDTNGNGNGDSGGGGIHIDLTDFLNGNDLLGNDDDEADEDIDLNEFLQDQDEEEIDLDDILNDQEVEEEEELIVEFDGEYEEEVATYELDEDGDDGADYLLDNGDVDIGEIIYDEDGKPIGRAARANAEKHAELTNMLGGH